MSITVTKRQRQVLDFIAGFIIKHQYSPTLREIGGELGITSTNGVSDHIKALQKKGFLMQTPEGMKTRVIRLTAVGRMLYPEMGIVTMMDKLNELRNLVDEFPNNILPDLEGKNSAIEGAEAVLDIVSKIIKGDF